MKGLPGTSTLAEMMAHYDCKKFYNTVLRSTTTLKVPGHERASAGASNHENRWEKSLASKAPTPPTNTVPTRNGRSESKTLRLLTTIRRLKRQLRWSRPATGAWKLESRGQRHKTFYGRKLWLFIIRRSVCPGKLFQPRLMFAGKARAPRAPQYGGFLAIPTNRLSWKSLPWTNALAYHEKL